MATVISSSLCQDFKPSEKLTVQVHKGCTTERLLYRMQRSANPWGPPGLGQLEIDFHYNVFIIYMGGNDISDGMCPGNIVSNLCRCVELLQTVRPGCIVAVSGLLPRPREPHLNHLVKLVNQLLQARLGRRFLAVYRRFLYAGEPNQELYSWDGVHLSKKGTETLQSSLTTAAIHLARQ